MNRLIYVLIAVIFTLSGCQITSKRTVEKTQQGNLFNKSCGVSRGSFLGSWFDYYERGLSYADCAMWLESEQDLRKALSKRSVDKRRAYSLGMHLIPDYFPNRELGVVLFYQKKYAESEKLLKISLSQFPSSKAEEYLKRVRAIQLSLNNEDTQAPVILIDTPALNSISSSTIVRVSGSVQDDSFIDKLEINGVPYRYIPKFTTKQGTPVRLARRVSEMDFSIDVPLHYEKGHAIVEVVASDITGKTTRQQIKIVRDQQGPQINLKKVEKMDSHNYHIVLDARDEHSSIKQIKINDKDYQFQIKKVKDKISDDIVDEVHIDEIVSGPFDQEHILVIMVDQAGNKTQALLKEKHFKYGDGSQESETMAPEFSFIKGREPRKTLEKMAYIEGEVGSDSVITKLQVNGENILNGQSKQVYFNYSAELKPGNNAFHLLAESVNGQLQQVTLNISQESSPSRSIKERLEVAHFPFPCNLMSRSPCPLSATLYENLNDKLIERQRFQVTDRSKINHLIDITGRCEDEISDNCVVKIAERLVSKSIWEETFDNAMFVGSVTERTNNKGQTSVEIFGRMVDSASKDILTSVDIYAENLSSLNFQQFSIGLITEISDAFPLVDSKILDIFDDKISLDMTEKDRVWERMPLLIYKVADNQGCGKARLMDVDEQETKALLATNSCKSFDKNHYRVITR